MLVMNDAKIGNYLLHPILIIANNVRKCENTCMHIRQFCMLIHPKAFQRAFARKKRNILLKSSEKKYIFVSV